jgi:SAM-dependent methyltransferase
MGSGTFGRLSPWRDARRLDPDRARELAFRNLETRGKSADEVAARAEYLELLALAPGERVLDVGCGSGVVTRDIARRVSPGGRAVGVDPSPVFLGIARDLAREAGIDTTIDLHEGNALALPFGEGEFDAAVAATVLVHVPGGRRAIPEMARVVRSGGRVGIFDLDGDFFLVSHPDHAMTRRITAAFSDHATVDGWLSRDLPGLFRQTGLRDVRVRGFMPLEQKPDGFYAGLVADRAAAVAFETGSISESERDAWLATWQAERAAGNCLAGRLHLFCWGVKP